MYRADVDEVDVREQTLRTGWRANHQRLLGGAISVGLVVHQR